MNLLARKTSRVRRLAGHPALHKIAYIVFVFVFVCMTISWGYQARHKNDPSVRGVSFSVKYAEELGLDWQQTFLALLDELEIKHFRLMSYWDTTEFGPDVYDWQKLDWQIDQVGRHGGTVTLAVGQRQPRWPECHIPEWAQQLDEDEYRKELLSFIQTTANRYKSDDAVISYQLENEAANRHFGICPVLDEKFLSQEKDALAAAAPEKPIVINASNQSGTPLFGPVGDSVGYSIYKKAGFNAFGKFWSWDFWYVPAGWHSFRAALTEGIRDTDTFVHELQAEPWGPEATVRLSEQEQDKTMDPDQLRSIVDFADDTGMKTMYLWGAEWWHWRLTQFDDTELWNTAKDIFKSDA